MYTVKMVNVSNKNTNAEITSGETCMNKLKNLEQKLGILKKKSNSQYTYEEKIDITKQIYFISNRHS